MVVVGNQQQQQITATIIKTTNEPCGKPPPPTPQTVQKQSNSGGQLVGPTNLTKQLKYEDSPSNHLGDIKLLFIYSIYLKTYLQLYHLPIKFD
jgi:hypothetical protein